MSAGPLRTIRQPNSAEESPGGTRHSRYLVGSTLSTTIAAIPAIEEDGNSRLGPITRFAKDAQLHVCGDGFSQRTVNVQCEGRCYFVFREDIKDVDNRG